MSRRRTPREKDLTRRYVAGELDDVDLDQQHRFGSRSKDAQMSKLLRTVMMRADEQVAADIAALPIGQVVQVFSLYSEVESQGKTFLCVIRKTLNKKSATAVLVGDYVRFRDLGLVDEQGKPQAVVEEVLPRETILTRSDSFKGTEQHPIVANAQQMLIVASLLEPRVKWGLVDRMIIAALSGNLRPIVCLNKIDLKPQQPEPNEASSDERVSPSDALAHYQSVDICTLQTSAERSYGLEELKSVLKDSTTVLAGHSGVGKSTLINAIAPSLDLRTGQISGYTGKGRHTTTSARRYPLDFGGAVIDTPGVKLFGLWNINRDNLIEYFPDIKDDRAPAWRQESYERIAASIQD